MSTSITAVEKYFQYSLGRQRTSLRGPMYKFYQVNILCTFQTRVDYFYPSFMRAFYACELRHNIMNKYGKNMSSFKEGLAELNQSFSYNTLT